MGMIMNYLRVPKAEFDKYLKEPKAFEEEIYTLFEVEETSERLFDIDKAWSGIMYLLTGSTFVCGYEEDEDDDVSRLFFSGQLFDEQSDFYGFGPAHYITPAQVAALSKRLSAMSEADLRENYNPEEMAANEELYPSLEWNEDDFSYLKYHFEKLQQFFATAAQNGEAIVSFLW
ncbi:YfbM family protein [Capnocytophaga leadbetteri]